MQLLLLVFATVFIAEMGDKTQLLLIAMAGKYKVRHILTGTWAATVVLNLLAVGVGAALSQYLDMRIIKTAAALAFFYFAWSGLRAEEDEEEKQHSSKLGPVAAIFASFFLGELGDKTQLSGITLAAAYTAGSMMNALWIFLGCTLGLILADLLGLLAGLLLKSKLPTRVLNDLTFAIFTLFGILNTREAALLFFPENTAAVWAVTVGAALLFGALCCVTILKKKKEA